MLRLHQVASALKAPLSQVSKDLVIKAHGRYITRVPTALLADLIPIQEDEDVVGERYFAFPSSKEVMLPHSLAREYAHHKHKRDLPTPLPHQLCPMSSLSTSSTVQRQVGVLLGHYNHGKTSLLDALIQQTTSTKSQIVSTERHGITQEVRTTRLSLSPQKEITLIDTPGQDVFYRMRNTGAEIADFAMLLVASDQGYCEQTEESIGIVEGLQVPTLVCLNKIDLLPETERKQKLDALITTGRNYNALSSSKFIPISATNGRNVDVLCQEMQSLFNSKNYDPKNRENVHGASSSVPKYLTGRAYVFNILTSKPSTQHSHGVILHLLLKQGKVAVGDYFSANGWFGKVQSVRPDAIPGQEGAEKDVQMAEGPGLGVHVTVALDRDCHSAFRPLGDYLHFYSVPSSTEGNSAVSKKDRDRMLKEAYEEAKSESDQQYMIQCLQEFEMSPMEQERFRVHTLFAKSKIWDQYLFSEGDAEEDDDDDDTESEEDSEREGEYTAVPAAPSSAMSVEDQLSQYLQKTQVKLVLKASSDMEIGTIQDAYDDAMETINTKLEDSTNPLTLVKTLKLPHRIVHGGVGSISLHDVTLAKAANKIIISYDINHVEKHAALEIQKHGIKVIHLDKIQDIIAFIAHEKPLQSYLSKKRAVAPKT